MKDYGQELIIDLHDCNNVFFDRDFIKKYFTQLCELIDMEPEDLHFWDDLNTPEDEKETEDHLIGTSAIQFIRTSNITIHTLDVLKRVYVNIFSCKDFNSHRAANFTREYFEGIIVQSTVINRR